MLQDAYVYLKNRPFFAKKLTTKQLHLNLDFRNGTHLKFCGDSVMSILQ